MRKDEDMQKEQVAELEAAEAELVVGGRGIDRAVSRKRHAT